MPSFLNPLVLVALSAAAIPLLIHLFTRRRLKRVEFSSLWFLRNLERTKLRQVKLKNLLLLLLRTLILVLIVLAFARPALKGELAGLGKAAASSVVILLDDSYSMATQTGQGTLFETAQKKAAQVLDYLTSQDECAVIYASSPESTAFNREPGSLKEEIMNHRPSFANSDFVQSLTWVKKLLEGSSNLNREVYVLTDKNGSGWERLSSLEKKAIVYWFELSDEEIRNLSVAEIDFGQQLIEPGRSFSLKANLSNQSQKQADNWLVGFYLDGRKVAQTDIDLRPKSRAAIEFEYAVARPGFHDGFFELAEDDLPSDNYRYFGFRIPEQIRVLLVGESVRDNRFLQLALRPETELNLSLEVSSLAHSALGAEELGQYDVVILNDLTTLTENTLRKLAGFWETGGGVWIILGSRADAEFYSRKVTERFFGLGLNAGESQGNIASGFYGLERWDLNHPVFSIYQNLDSDQLPKLKFYQIKRVKPGADAKILAYFSDGSPALMETGIEPGKALLFLAGIDSTSSDVAWHPFFVPWVNRMVGYLAQDVDAAGETFSVGEVVFRQLQQIPANQSLQLVYPNQARENLTPLFTATAALVKVENTRLPGIYKIMAGEKVLDQFAVNLEPEESEPQKIDLKKIQATLQSQNQDLKLVEVPVRAEVVESIQRVRYGRELWRETLILALLLLGVEMWLGRSMPKGSGS
jgi:hypothetical protein